MFKNEKHALRQWVIHHLAQGVNHLLLVDNNSPRSAESCELEEFISAGIVTLVEEPARHQQQNCRTEKLVNQHMHRFLPRTRWVLNLDFDEFLYARKESATVLDYLQALDDSTVVVKLPWKISTDQCTNYIYTPPAYLRVP